MAINQCFYMEHPYFQYIGFLRMCLLIYLASSSVFGNYSGSLATVMFLSKPESSYCAIFLMDIDGYLVCRR